MTKHNFSYCLWFDNEADPAADFYTSIFPGSKKGDVVRYGKEGHEIHHQPEGKVMTVEFTLAGADFVGLNGGPEFKINPSISFFVLCESASEVDTIWKKLSEGASVLMPMDKYDWSEKYGWLQDRFGVSWQVALGKMEEVGQKITPSFLFVGDQCGRAEEAIERYTSVFENSKVDGILRYGSEEAPDKPGTVKHGQFSLNGQKFMIMDSNHKHAFQFNEAVSIVVNCDTQKEIDFYWKKLLADGGEEGPCGWLKDKFGVSWQVAPVQLTAMLKDDDKKKTERVTKAFMQMKKLDLKELERVFNGD